MLLLLLIILSICVINKIEKQKIKKYNVIKHIKLQKQNEIIYERRQRKKQYEDILDLNQTFIRIAKNKSIFSSEYAINTLAAKENRIFIFNFLRQCLIEDIQLYSSDVTLQNEINDAFDVLIQKTELKTPYDNMGWYTLKEEIMYAVYIILSILDRIANEIKKKKTSIGNEINTALLATKDWLKEWNDIINLLQTKGYRARITIYMYEFYVGLYDVFNKYLDCMDRLEK